MPLYEPIVPARYVLPLLEFVGEQRAAQLHAILGLAGLAREELQGADAALPMARFDALMRACTEVLGRSDVGFELGKRIGVDQHGALTQLLRCAATGDALLRMIERYFRLISPAFVTRYVRQPLRSEWIVRVAAGMSTSTLHQLLEMQAVAFRRDIMAFLGSDAGVEIHLSIPAPAHRRRYRELGAVRVHFAAQELPEMRCIVPTPLLDVPLLQTAQAGADISARLDRALRLIPPTRSIAPWVRLILGEAEGAQPSLATLAGFLNVCPRTMTRMLTAEGVDLRQLSMQIRHRRACEMLAKTQLSLEVIASRLGYADTTTFGRAFRKLQGSSPGNYRRAHARLTVA